MPHVCCLSSRIYSHWERSQMKSWLNIQIYLGISNPCITDTHIYLQPWAWSLVVMPVWTRAHTQVQDTPARTSTDRPMHRSRWTQVYSEQDLGFRDLRTSFSSIVSASFCALNSCGCLVTGYCRAKPDWAQWDDAVETWGFFGNSFLTKPQQLSLSLLCLVFPISNILLTSPLPLSSHSRLCEPPPCEGGGKERALD